MPPQPPLAVTVRTPMLCMVVDDDRVCRLVMQHQLALLGLPAFSVASCENALAQSLLCRPAAVLLDTCLPDGDGYGLAMRLRRQSSDACRPPPLMISLSARSDDAHRRCCHAAGIDTVLTKPASPAQLARALGVETASGGVRIADFHVLASSSAGGAPDGLMEVYRRACASDLDGLKQAVSHGDACRARAFAHRLRGASAWVGADVVSAIAAVFEPPEGACAAEPFIQAAALRWLDRIFRSGSFRPSAGGP